MRRRRHSAAVQHELVSEAARIICEEHVTDYRLAKQKAASRLRLGPKPPMPDNQSIQNAVLEYQRLFGGSEYADRLVRLRRTAVQAMRLLRDFNPRLVGAVATGATTDAHLVRLHGFADKPEMLDLFLQNSGIPFETGERRYRYSDGRIVEIPTCEFLAGDIGVEMALFSPDDIRRAPLSPVDGLPMKRLDLSRVEALANAPVDTLAV